MKKISTTLALIFAAISMFGQSLHLLIDQKDVTNTTINIPVVSGDLSETQIGILNTTGNSIDYQVNRTILNPPMNDSCASLYFCAGITCYPPNSSITWTPKTSPVTIKAHGSMPDGNGTYGVFAHYDVCPDICNDLYVRYRVYNTASNTNDTAFLTIKYTCSNGIEKHSKNAGTISDAYPNPANTGFSANYQLNGSTRGEIVVSDIIGKEIQRISVNDKEGHIYVNTSQLTSGVYFYSLLVNGSNVTTKKVVIQ